MLLLTTGQGAAAAAGSCQAGGRVDATRRAERQSGPDAGCAKRSQKAGEEEEEEVGREKVKPGGGGRGVRRTGLRCAPPPPARVSTEVSALGICLGISWQWGGGTVSQEMNGRGAGVGQEEANEEHSKFGGKGRRVRGAWPV